MTPRIATSFSALLLAATGLAETFVVAPFSNRTNDAKLDWIGESISEAIREAAEASRLGVVLREDREQAVKRLSLRLSSQLSLASIVKLAEATSSERAVYGKFELAPNAARPASKGSLRITARVFDVKKILQVTEVSALGAIEDLPVLEADLAWDLLRALTGREKVARLDLLREHRAVKVNALEYYVRGLMATGKWMQHRYFTQAARLDPKFPHPNFHLGRMQFEDERYREAAGWLEKVPDDLPYSEEAAFMLALSRYEISDYESARKVLEKVEPKLPVPEIWNNLGAALARLNRPEALTYFRRAMEADPADSDYQFNAGYVLWKMRDFANAADRFRAALDRSPDDQDAILLLGKSLASSGPRPGEIRTEGLERLKDSYIEPSKPVESASLAK